MVWILVDADEVNTEGLCDECGADAIKRQAARQYRPSTGKVPAAKSWKEHQVAVGQAASRRAAETDAETSADESHSAATSTSTLTAVAALPG